MLQVRQGVFETNSSSTRSITIAPQSDFDKWKNGEVYLNDGWWSDKINDPNKNKTFLTVDEAVNLVKAWKDVYGDDDDDAVDYDSMDILEKEEKIEAYEIYTFEYYFSKSWLETYEEHYTTEHGDDVVAFGYYGYDG